MISGEDDGDRDSFINSREKVGAELPSCYETGMAFPLLTQDFILKKTRKK